MIFYKFRYFDNKNRQIVQTMYILKAYNIFNLKISFASKSYLATIVRFNPLKGDVETVVAHAIKKVIASKVWFTPLKKSPIIAIVIIGWIPINPKIIKIANNIDANLVHEAAIGKIAGEQLIKLMTLGLTEKEAEEHIISGFLKN